MLPGIDFGQWVSALTLSEVLSMVLGYVEALAWPLTVAFGVWVFRAPLTKLLTRITKFSAFGVESSFDDKARQNARNAEAVKDAVVDAGESAGEAGVPNRTPAADSDHRGDPVDPLVAVVSAGNGPARPSPPFMFDQQDPSILGVFISRWNRLERVAKQVLEALDQSANKPGSFRRIANVSQTFAALAEAGFVPTQAVEVAEQTQRLRGEIVHGHKDLSLDALENVLTSITSLEQALRIARGRMAIQKVDMNQVLPRSEWP